MTTLTRRDYVAGDSAWICDQCNWKSESWWENSPHQDWRWVRDRGMEHALEHAGKHPVPYP